MKADREEADLIARAKRRPWSQQHRCCGPLVLLAALLALSGCNEIVSGPAAAVGTASAITLAPIPRGGEMPTYTVNLAQAWQLTCPTQAPGDAMPRLGAALVTFPQVAVELELHGWRARLRCARPRGATEIAPLTVCTFAGEPLGQVQVDQEITLEGFLGQRARVTFDLGTVTLPPAEKSGLPEPPVVLRNTPRMLLDPVASIRILNHSTRSLQWQSPAGAGVLVKSQERAELQLAVELHSLHRTELEPRHLTPGQLYTAAENSQFFVCHPDGRLTILTNLPDEKSVLSIGDQTRLEIPPPSGRIDIEGRWTLILDSLGRWSVRLGFTRDGRYPILVNRGETPVNWISLVSLEEVSVPDKTWRMLKPLP